MYLQTIGKLEVRARDEIINFQNGQKSVNVANEGTDRRSMIPLEGTITVAPFEAILIM